MEAIVMISRFLVLMVLYPTTATSSACVVPGPYPDPEDCSKFLVCYESTGNSTYGITYSCQEDHIFSPDLRTCISKEEATCTKKREVLINTGYTRTISQQLTRQSAVRCQTGGASCADCQSLVVCASISGALIPVYTQNCSESNEVCDRNQCTASVSEGECRAKDKSRDRCKMEGYFPDPDDCKKYYTCIMDDNGKFLEESFECDNGFVYNATSELCEEVAGGAACTTTPLDCAAKMFARFTDYPQYYIMCISKTPAIKLTLMCPDSSVFSEVTNTCVLDCRDKGRFPDPSNCTSYYECRQRGTQLEATLMTCPAGQAFSPTQRMCVPRSRVPSCTNGPLPPLPPFPPQPTFTPVTTRPVNSTETSICNNREGRFADSTNCRRYYLCARLNGQIVSSLRPCPLGYFFNAAVNLCRPGNC